MERCRLGLLVMVGVLVMAACGGSDSTAPTADAAPTATSAAAPTPTAAPVVADDPAATPDDVVSATPTAEAVAAPALSDAERLAAAEAAFAVDFGGAYESVDVIDVSVAGERVLLTACVWSGIDVYDEVIEARYNVSTDADGQPIALLFADNSTRDDCLSAGLVESAFAFIDVHDTYWVSVLDDPTTFDPEGEARNLFSPGNLDLTSETVAGWVDDGVHWRGPIHQGDVGATATQPPVWRRYEGRNAPVFSIAVCRNMSPDYGLYRDDLLLDNLTSNLSFVADNSLIQYKLVRVDGEWRLGGTASLVWADCLGAGTFLDGVTSWDPDPVAWSEFP